MSLHTAVSLAPPSFQIHYRDDIIHSHMNLSIVGNSYGAMATLTHIANVLTGSAMVIATTVVIKLWRNDPPDPNESDAVGKRFNHLIDNYQKKNRSNTEGSEKGAGGIAAIQTMFEGWFVAYWTDIFFY